MLEPNFRNGFVALVVFNGYQEEKMHKIYISHLINNASNNVLENYCLLSGSVFIYNVSKSMIYFKSRRSNCSEDLSSGFPAVHSAETGAEVIKLHPTF